MPEFRTAVAACPSVDRLCDTAVAHKMLGHLHRLVTASEAEYEAGAAAVSSPRFDPVLVERLTALQRLSAERNLRLTGRLLRLLELLRQAGVEAIPYKGPALAERLYGDPTLRVSADLDVLVRRRQATLARTVLLGNGFRDVHDFSEELIGLERGRWGAIELVSDEEGPPIDLHWELAMGLGSHAMKAETLMVRAKPQRLLGKEVLGLSDADLLLASCMHGAKDKWSSMEALLGLAVQVRDRGAEGWSEIMAAASEEASKRRVAVGVAHVCRVFGLQTPAEVRDALTRDRVARALLRSLGPKSLVADSGSSSRLLLERLGWVVASEDSLPRGLWYGLVRSFKPGPLDWRSHALPRRARWLYYFTRPFRLATRWLRRA
ncbi:MAG: nucleotidyltransferase family protein [Armatimonadetes bacterium]|nr:nucleotidyltransferase family protein [Armatimonadota bacterium]